ncbi:hypothetical protein D3C73_1169780 [compost metagenome]
MDAVFEKLRGHGLVALSQRLEPVGIDEVVELENRTVDAFPRIVFRGCLGSERNQQHAGAHTKLS